MEKKFKVVFTGRLQQDRDPEEIYRGIAAVFRVDAEKVRTIFRKDAVVVSAPDRVTAERYALAIKRAGALCAITCPPEAPPQGAGAPPEGGKAQSPHPGPNGPAPAGTSPGATPANTPPQLKRLPIYNVEPAPPRGGLGLDAMHIRIIILSVGVILTLGLWIWYFTEARQYQDRVLEKQKQIYEQFSREGYPPPGPGPYYPYPQEPYPPNPYEPDRR